MTPPPAGSRSSGMLAAATRWRRPAVAGLLAIALLPGPLQPGEIPVLLALVAAATLRPAGEPVDPPPRLEGLVVIGLTLAFLARAAALPVRDQPIGTDWLPYLNNAIAIAEGDWPSYHRWRGPLHAWLSLKLIPVGGGLVEASQLLALVAQTACLPLTWCLGRLTLGRWPALFGTILLASWPDPLVFARMSTPYPLLAVLFLLGATLTAASLTASSLKGRLLWAVPAGVALGLAVATDVRGGTLAAGVVAAAILAAILERTRRGLVVALLVGGLSAGVGEAIVTRLPVQLMSLRDQIALQRDLNAREGRGRCGAQGRLLPTPADLVGPCGRTTLAGNLHRAQATLPVSVAFLALLVALGLAAAPRGPTYPPRWGRALLLLPVLPALPSLALVGVQHRYVLPLMPLATLLAGAALARLTRPAIAGALCVAMLVAWGAWPGTLLARALGRGNAPIAPMEAIEDDRGYAMIHRILRTRRSDGDRVVDCAHGSLPTRLYPVPVEEWRSGPRAKVAQRCLSLLAEGASRPTWLVVPHESTDAVSDSWNLVYSFDRGGGLGAVGVFVSGTSDLSRPPG